MASSSPTQAGWLKIYAANLLFQSCHSLCAVAAGTPDTLASETIDYQMLRLSRLTIKTGSKDPKM